jgi:flagellar hook-basal body complex protein FliE
MDPHEDMSLQEALLIIDNMEPRERIASTTARVGSYSNSSTSPDDQNFAQAVKSELRALNNSMRKMNNKMEHFDAKTDSLTIAFTSSFNSMKILIVSEIF